MDPHLSPKPNLCVCQSTAGLFLTRRQASALLSATLICLVLSYVTGYFWGRRQPLQALTDALAQGQKFGQTVKQNDLSVTPNLPVLDPLTGGAEQASVSASDQSLATEPSATTPLNSSRSVVSVTTPQYRAELISFNSLKSAQRFAQKLQQAGFTVQVKARRTQLTHSKLHQTYQVVTEQFTERAQLTQLLTRLQQQFKLGKVKIITVPTGAAA